MAYEDELQEYFDGFSHDLREQLSGVIREEAERLSAAQRARLKELEQSPDETGNLEASCIVVEGANELEWIVQAGGDLTTGDIRQRSGVEYDYAEAFEFGTSKQPARPFFWPVYREMKDDIATNIAEATSEVLK